MENVEVNRFNPLWDHTVKRVKNAENKAAGDNKKFVSIMVTRMKKITHMEKIYYTIEVLKERNHQDVVDIYEGRIVMEKFLEMEN